MDATRIINIQALRDQIPHQNDQTIQINPKLFQRVEFRALFEDNFSEIQEFNTQYKDGLCIYIFSGQELIGKAFLKTKTAEGRRALNQLSGLGEVGGGIRIELHTFNFL